MHKLPLKYPVMERQNITAVLRIDHKHIILTPHSKQL